MRAGDLIKKIRQIAGLNQTTLGSVLGVSQSRITRYETHTGRVPEDVLNQLYVFSQKMSALVPARREEIEAAWAQFNASPDVELPTADNADNIIVSGILLGLGLILIDWLKNSDD